MWWAKNFGDIASIIEDNWHLFTRTLTSLLNMFEISANQILTQELKMKYVYFVWVPHLLTWEQMELGRGELEETSRSGLQYGEITTMIPNLNVKVRCGCEKGSKNIRKFGSRNRWGGPIGDIFDCSGMIYQHICPPQQRINGEYYTTILKWFLEQIRRNTELVNNTSHKTQCVTEFLEEHNVEVIEHPPYSLDLAPRNFWLFSAPKKILKLFIHLWTLCSQTCSENSFFHEPPAN